MRLELIRLSTLPPQDSVSTNSTTTASLAAKANTTITAAHPLLVRIQQVWLARFRLPCQVQQQNSLGA